MQIESTKHHEQLLVPVSFFAHEKRGIHNRSEFIMSIDKPNFGVLIKPTYASRVYEPMECYIILVHLQYKLYC